MLDKDKDIYCLDRYDRGDLEGLKLLIDRHQQRIFALVLHLIGNDRDKVYDIVVSSFIETIRATHSFGTKNTFLIRLARTSIDKSRDIKTVLSSEESGFEELPLEKTSSIRFVRSALRALHFETRTLLLLRDQLHLPYDAKSTLYPNPVNIFVVNFCTPGSSSAIRIVSLPFGKVVISSSLFIVSICSVTRGK